MLFVAALLLEALPACKGGNSSPGPTPTPVAGPLVPSPAAVKLSISGAGGLPKGLASIVVTQTNVPLGASANFSPATCFTPMPYFEQINNIANSVNSTTFMLTSTISPIIPIAAGTCVITVTSSTGSPPATTTIPVTINP